MVSLIIGPRSQDGLVAGSILMTNYLKEGYVSQTRSETARGQDFFIAELGLNPRSVAY